MIKLKIDPEFRDKIPALTDAEFEQLKENILADGEVYEPIITWQDTIVDGHNRWKIICENWEKLKDKFRTKPMDFADKWEAFDWMYRKQLGRRNLSDENRTYIIGKMYEVRKKTSGGTGANQYTKVKEQDAQNGQPVKVADKASHGVSGELAIELNVGRNTVRRAEHFAKGVDAVREVSPEAADRILAGGSGLNKSFIAEIPSKTTQEIEELAKGIISGEAKKNISASRKTSTKQDQEDRAMIAAICADMQDPTTRPEFTVEMLLEDIQLNGRTYVELLRNTLTDRSTLLVGNNRELVADAIQKYVINPIIEVKELLR